ncbi:YgjV family protein [Rouxiella sp. Mn2063]|uniref:YgjV family protein n=1 Tax=Rouxiella sp. Mn2063 TaxID=3395262 RepID=UPI003BD76F09
MSPFVLSQCIASLSFALDLTAFHFRQRNTSLRLLALSTGLLALHFLLLEQSTAAGLMLLAAVRFLTATWSTRREWCGLFCALAVIFSLVTWQMPRDVFPLAGSLLLTLAAFQPHQTTLRLFTALGSLCWLINNILAGSPVAVLMELAFMASTLISYFRLYKITDKI